MTNFRPPSPTARVAVVVCVVEHIGDSFYHAIACNATHGIAMRILSVQTSVTLNDLEQRNSPYFALFHRISA